MQLRAEGKEVLRPDPIHQIVALQRLQDLGPYPFEKEPVAPGLELGARHALRDREQPGGESGDNP
jgi:hypothetical protein